MGVVRNDVTGRRVSLNIAALAAFSHTHSFTNIEIDS